MTVIRIQDPEVVGIFSEMNQREGTVPRKSPQIEHIGLKSFAANMQANTHTEKPGRHQFLGSVS